MAAEAGEAAPEARALPDISALKLPDVCLTHKLQDGPAGCLIFQTVAGPRSMAPDESLCFRGSSGWTMFDESSFGLSTVSYYP